MHELDPSYSGISPGDAQTTIDVARWRKSQRERLIAERLAVPADARAEAARRIANRLDAEIGIVEGSVVGIYWPFRGEPDLREWASSVPARGGQLALPVVLEKGKPLEFRTWSAGEKLEKGVWNIPVPAGGTATLPDIVVVPVVGYDDAGFRLGYGGGFYDRTLAAMPSRPLTFGVGYELAKLPTIYPQWHDIPLDRMIIDGA
ncbi:5-formyltetrahydrofolate cyclo-ligase [Aquibium oceanicum]|uniref:5-formyltetrahydrofolate cyclo-ligase n=2 Tax=Aquibium oceanicum TaxID=1670800 RepID=A0A1L3SU09_9HYPH|nr:5-formyltetrahydrofolate cyclo-ligase [Aquibium oceanicum]